MVRVGGGWVALDEFLLKNDPCRGMFEFFLVIRNTCNIKNNPFLNHRKWSINFNFNFNRKN